MAKFSRRPEELAERSPCERPTHAYASNAFPARRGNLWVVLSVYRARRGQGTCPQDKPVDSRCAVRDLTTAPRLVSFGLTR
jgi:hypothetical protein